MVPPERDEERTASSRGTTGGAAIAPPPSLQESTDGPAACPSPRQTSANSMGYATSSVAAKIMAKYGFKVRMPHIGSILQEFDTLFRPLSLERFSD